MGLIGFDFAKRIDALAGSVVSDALNGDKQINADNNIDAEFVGIAIDAEYEALVASYEGALV